ncbi:MAG: methyltransferase [Desulfobacterales bacterium]|nr:methyltransferase [Desulfobacterales bacterium]MCP4163547.1 methyltransferase [Deltaproteobacteria bacterium]
MDNNTPEQLMKLITAKWISKPIYIVSKLGIADLLSKGAMSITEIAQKTSSNEDYLYRIMRALSSFGIFKENRERQFEQTDMSSFLQKNVMGTFAILFNGEWNDKAWLELFDCVKTGEIPFEKAHGKNIMKYLKEDKYAFKIHNEANAIKSSRTHRAIVDCYDFSQFKTLTDVGGGTGALLSEILFENPELQGILAEQPDVILESEFFIEKFKFNERMKTATCDFFKEVPKGSEAYLLSHILHDWNDEQCELILKNLRKVIGDNSKLLICEMIITEPNTSDITTLLDLEMLVMTGGRERTLNEYEFLLNKTGYKISEVFETMEGVSLIEAVI